jgi:phosphoribosylformylglycinamidine cyclo-ligase
MFKVYNMGVGFCVVVGESNVSLALSILEQHRRKVWVIGEVIQDPTKGVYLARHRLEGHKKQFREA